MSDPLRDVRERKAFEQWYVENAFDYVRNPLGCRDCGMQWAAWQARAVGEQAAQTPAAPTYHDPRRRQT